MNIKAQSKKTFQKLKGLMFDFVVCSIKLLFSTKVWF